MDKNNPYDIPEGTPIQFDDNNVLNGKGMIIKTEKITSTEKSTGIKVSESVRNKEITKDVEKKIVKLVFTFIIIFLGGEGRYIYSQNDTLFFKNKFYKRGTVILKENPDYNYNPNYLYIDAVSKKNVTGNLILFGKKNVTIFYIEDGIPKGYSISYLKNKLDMIRIYYPYSKAELVSYFNSKKQLKQAGYYEEDSLISIKFKKNLFVVIESGINKDWKKYRIRKKNEAINMVLKELRGLGLIDNKNILIGTNYEISKEDLEHIYSLKKK